MEETPGNCIYSEIYQLGSFSHVRHQAQQFRLQIHNWHCLETHTKNPTPSLTFQMDTISSPTQSMAQFKLQLGQTTPISLNGEANYQLFQTRHILEYMLKDMDTFATLS